MAIPVSFYQKNLAADWTDGMSNGRFQDKKELIADLTDMKKIHARLVRAGVPKEKIVTLGPEK